jgi:hypothetical protein
MTALDPVCAWAIRSPRPLTVQGDDVPGRGRAVELLDAVRHP